MFSREFLEFFRMQKEHGKFELALSMEELIVLFFVMVVLFTGLLIFGYRVGYSQSTNAAKVQATPAPVQQESPQIEKQTPAVQAEPELRLENSPLKRGGQPFVSAQPGWDLSSHDPLVRQLGEAPQHPCKAGLYLSYLRKTLPTSHRLVERLADWGGVPINDASRSGRDRSHEPAAAAVNAKESGSAVEAETDACSLPADLKASRSVAC
jgi:hypothetical protein